MKSGAPTFGIYITGTSCFFEAVFFCVAFAILKITDLKLTDLSASAYQVLRLKIWSITPDLLHLA